jgi:hypothetical protein
MVLTRPLQTRIVAAATATVLSLTACDTIRGLFGTPLFRPDSAEVATLVRSYHFVDTLAPVASIVPLPGNTSVPDLEAPTDITIARAVPNTPPGPSGKVIMALVHSNRAYKHLGIAVGDNYVWRDSTSGDKKKWLTFMVPATVSSDAKKLKRDTVEYSMGDHKQPRLVRAVTRSVSFGVCLEDPACGTGHCGYGDVDAAYY